ncbi:contractile injection system protein, VgrG/Pvc8 family [Ideonella sp. DXS29W]|uniref:Contractile injection system protein, VgrG/Pvc8 family n=1 Tax=Ideonella lacteola TaxID=2984193 RepID=A0ABU9BVQ5_9BURK
MSEEGLVAWWEHTGEPGSPTLGQLTLVIADDVAALSANPQPSVRFTSSDHTLGEDSLTTLHSVRRVATQAVELTSRDYRSGGAVALQHRPVSSRAHDPLALFDHSIVDHPGLGRAPARWQPTLSSVAATRRTDTDGLDNVFSQRRGPTRQGLWRLKPAVAHSKLKGALANCLIPLISFEQRCARP